MCLEIPLTFLGTFQHIHFQIKFNDILKRKVFRLLFTIILDVILFILVKNSLKNWFLLDLLNLACFYRKRQKNAKLT